MWLTRDDVTRGTTLFQSPYNSALFYVYSICYTNIQLNALTFDKCFSSEDSHTEISKRFAWNALSRWHFISASLHLLYLHMFTVQNQKYYCINSYICQRRGNFYCRITEKIFTFLLPITNCYRKQATWWSFAIVFICGYSFQHFSFA